MLLYIHDHFSNAVRILDGTLSSTRERLSGCFHFALDYTHA
jgi:hypothetical protein